MQGVLAVYDVTNKKSFEHVEEWMKALREVGFLYLYFSCDHDPG
jgi:GTPase SAR1 family protein